MKALRSKKHVLCEKPVSTSASDYQELINVAKEVNRYIMDGTMFVHNIRTNHFLNYIAQDDVFGKVLRINSEFTFRGDEQFMANDIRTTKDGDPYGCIGDLGWYCVRLAQLVFREVKSGKVKSAQATNWKLNDEGVPIDANCFVFFHDEDAEDEEGSEHVLSFHCSFVHPLQQRVSICGTKQSLEMIDYVLPRQGPSTYTVQGQDLTVNDEYSVLHSDMMEAPDGPVQEVLMWRHFSKYCRATEATGCWDDVDANTVSSISLETQTIVDALMESIANGGNVVKL